MAVITRALKIRTCTVILLVLVDRFAAHATSSSFARAKKKRKPSG